MREEQHAINTTLKSAYVKQNPPKPFTYGKKADRRATSSLHSRASLDNYY